MDDEECYIHSFDMLPVIIIEHIFSFLSLDQLSSCGRVSRQFLMVANEVSRKQFFELYDKVTHELRRLKHELSLIPSTNEQIGRRLSVLRSYYVCEWIITELDHIKVIWRSVLIEGDGNSFSIGKVLDECHSALRESRRKNLPRWNPDNGVGSSMIRCSKLFFEKKLRQFKINQHFGCRILDVLSVLLEHEYCLDICIDIMTNTCTIDGLYKMDSPKYLNRPPALHDDNTVPNADDKKRIIQYIINFVRINNHVLLREEQYNREVEAAARTLLIHGNLPINIDSTDMWLLKELRDHQAGLNMISCELQRLNSSLQIKATFTSPTFDPRNLDKGFLCFIHLRCCMDDAPLPVAHSWKDIKLRVEDGSFPEDRNDNEELKNLLSVSNEISSDEGVPSSDQSPGGEYTFGCTLEASIITNNNLEVSALVFSDP